MFNFKFFLIIFSLVSFAGCSSSCNNAGTETAEINSNSSNTTNVIVPKQADNVNMPQSNQTAEMVPYNSKNGKKVETENVQVKKVDTSKVENTTPKKRMPENSELSTTMSKEGWFIETRKFNGHPDLDKLVRIIKTGKDISLKVHLKNGRIYDLQDGKLKNYRTDAAITILEAVGVMVEEAGTNAPSLDPDLEDAD